MRPSRDFRVLNRRVDRRLLRLRRVFGIACAIGEPHRSELLSYAAIELDNLIVSTLRNLAISSLRGGRTKKGQKVKTSRKFKGEDEVGAFALSVLNTNKYLRLSSPARVDRKTEPTVRDPRDTLKILNACAASNSVSLQVALSINSNVFDTLPTIRNFYAHRNQDTWQKVRTKAQSLGIFGASHPDDVITAKPPGRPVSLFEDWLDDCEIFFDEATK